MRQPSVFLTMVLLFTVVVSHGDALAMVGDVTARPANDNQWIPIPSWLSGTWQARFQTFLDTYDCRLGKRTLEQPATIPIHRQRAIGAQQDTSGQIWHYAGTPYIRNAETDSYSESQTITKLSVLNSEPSLLKLCTIGEVTRWSKSTDEVIDNFVERTIVSYSPLSEGVIKVDLTITDFDENGRALRQADSVCVERRIKPFVAINRDDRGDLREKFLRFQAERSVPRGHFNCINSSKPTENSNSAINRGSGNE